MVWGGLGQLGSMQIERHGRHWTIRYQDPVSGKRRRKRLREISVDEDLSAEQKTILIDEFRGALGSPGSLAAFIDEFEPTYLARGHRRPQQAVQTWRKIAALLGPVSFGEVTPQHCERAIASVGNQNSRRLYIARMRALWSEAIRWGLATRNPWSEVAKPKEHKREVPALQAEEVHRVLAAIPKAKRAFFAFLYETGLRRGEAEAVVWEDVKGNRLTVRASISKSGEPRVILLTVAALDVLSTIPRRRGIGQRNLLFPRPPTNAPLKTACRKAGVEEFTAHGLRHLHAIRCVRMGVRIEKVQAHLGHASIAETMRYAAYRPDDMAAEAMIDLEAHETALRARSRKSSS